MAQDKTPATLAYVAVIQDGYRLGIAKRNEPGYYATNYAPVESYDIAEQWAAACNRKLGLSPEEAMDIVTSSMVAQRRAEGRR